ncbi:hypothetical protein A3Q56_07004 [Intoshia linei]|uniref:MSP domain-containing protein n=1 Tax=Intoshia linei TaxID=1819745 RepID=A0A177ATG4_9BILA|nr:hypothetical protein A3Q56_07004 [Intoshia linei]
MFPSNVSSGNLAVFIKPTELHFITNEESRHKISLRIYNPYAMQISFRIRCTNPENYMLNTCKGHLNINENKIIHIEHIHPNYECEGLIDKFRIIISKKSDKSMRGFRDVFSILFPAVHNEVNVYEMNNVYKNNDSKETKSFEEPEKKLVSIKFQNEKNELTFKDNASDTTSEITKHYLMDSVLEKETKKFSTKYIGLLFILAVIFLLIIILPKIPTSNIVDMNYSVRLFSSFMLGVISTIFLNKTFI